MNALIGMKKRARTILDRFKGPEGQRNTIEGLRAQQIVHHADGLAKRLSAVAVLESYPLGRAFINQNDHTTDIFFILVGSVSIRINGREVNNRKAGQHVGEMAAIDVSALLSASVVATSETVVARITEPDFSKIAAEYPDIW